MLALTIVGINTVMGRLQQCVGIEFKRQTRMTGAQQTVIGKLVLAAEMAGQTQACTRDRLFGAVHAGLDVFFAARFAGDVLTQPFRGRPVAGFAADAIGQLEALAAYVGGHEGRVTGETLGRAGSVLYA